MFRAAVGQGGRRAAADAVDTPAREREAVRREVLHLRGEVDLPREPRLDGVLVGGRDLDEGPLGESADVSRHERLVEAARSDRLAQRRKERPERRAEDERRRDGGPGRDAAAPRGEAFRGQASAEAGLERRRRDGDEAGPPDRLAQGDARSGMSAAHSAHSRA